METLGAPISCLNLTKRFGSVVAVSDVTLDVGAGELVALLGPSGCGKTTLLRLLAGFEQLDDGQIVLGGEQVANAQRSVPPEKRNVGLVFQDHALFPHMTAERNVSYGLSHTERRSGRAKELLRLVGLESKGSRHPAQLSGGEQQRVALARALGPRPRVVLLDEPFANLDTQLRTSLREDVCQVLRTQGATAIMVTHDQEEALSIADRVGVMIDGKLAQIGSPLEVYEQPVSIEVARLLGDGNLIPGAFEGGCVRCEFGKLPSACPAKHTGECEVFVRAEAIQMVPLKNDEPTATASGVTVTGGVEQRVYFGHDGAALVRTGEGRLVRVRLGAGEEVRVGQRVSLRVSGPVMAYPGGNRGQSK